MSANIKLFKIKLIQNFLSASSEIRNQLLDELIIYATDPIKHMRRIRMLAQLSDYESQIVKKIENFTTDNPDDLNLSFLQFELQNVCNRSA